MNKGKKMATPDIEKYFFYYYMLFDEFGGDIDEYIDHLQYEAPDDVLLVDLPIVFSIKEHLQKDPDFIKKQLLDFQKRLDSNKKFKKKKKKSKSGRKS